VAISRFGHTEASGLAGRSPDLATFHRVSGLRLTDTHVRLVHRDVADPGAWPGLEHFTEEQYDEDLTAFLRDRPEGPIGVFAYGSLIWRRVFEPTAEFRATALG
jgi:glutathione-specific gamma-glutamylcyclotransferase